MSTVAQQQAKLLGEHMVSVLEKNNFTATYVDTKEEVLDQLLKLIPTGVSVGFAGSMTVKATGIEAVLKDRGNTIIDHGDPTLSPEEKNKARHDELSCHTFLTSTNALTQKGELVNIDGSGNRVSAMIFGPKQTILIVGINKIVPTLDAAMERIHQWAAPMNNIRIGTGNPCTKVGFCVDCASPKRICNVTTIINRNPSGGSHLHVLIVGESLGY